MHNPLSHPKLILPPIPHCRKGHKHLLSHPNPIPFMICHFPHILCREHWSYRVCLSNVFWICLILTTTTATDTTHTWIFRARTDAVASWHHAPSSLAPWEWTLHLAARSHAPGSHALHHILHLPYHLVVPTFLNVKFTLLPCDLRGLISHGPHSESISFQTVSWSLVPSHTLFACYSSKYQTWSFFKNFVCQFHWQPLLTPDA